MLVRVWCNFTQNTKVRVWDSTAEIRYLVLPILPDKYKDFDEEQLSEIISRDAMIGTALIGDPS